VTREHLPDGVWPLGVCPFCGAPPGFGDVVEDGRRRLACHVCGGSWTASRTWCPFCGNAESQDLRRLEPESGDEGYFISACTKCRAYLKELDRRVRWNGGPALVEDWGSPHLDLIAQRSGYWRPLPTIVDLGKRSDS
jgi:FdhE protein